MSKKLTTDNGKWTIRDKEELSEDELREMMGPAAASSIGYVPRETEKQKRDGDKRRREVRDSRTPRSALRARSALEAMAESGQLIVDSGQFRKKELFREFWREGELVVLVGESGVGKSILAMQVADSAAREFTTEAQRTQREEAEFLTQSGEDRKGTQTLYIDLEKAEIQRVQRYSGYEFAEGLEWADVGSFGVMHSKYRGSVTRFLVDSVYETIRNREPDVVFIDNLTYLLRAGRRHVDLPALMKTLRRMVNDTGLSMMLLAHSDSRVGRSRYLDERNYHVGFELADGVLALCHSTMDRTFRYVKSVFPADTRSDEVASYQLVTSPFLRFEFVGMMEEAAHLRDYREHAKLVASAIKHVEERFGGRRRKFRAAVPSRFELKGIEEVSEQ
jgi:KaiC/GvpD/RAD55 family RecA-like ATPase